MFTLGNMFKDWTASIFRAPEDEGAGGASAYDAGEGAQPAPENDRTAAFERRLDAIAGQMSQLAEGQRSRDARQQLSDFENTLKNRISQTDAAVTTAEGALAVAYDEGDSSKIARAQRALTEAVAQHDRAKLDQSNYEFRRREEERKAQQPPAQQPQGADTTLLDQWKGKHRNWYGVDQEMTRHAHAVDESIRNTGAIAVGSREYFDAIDRSMRQKFPDRMGGTPPTAGGGGGQGGGADTRPRIQQSVVDGWRKMGLNVDDPEVVKRLVGHRKGLVDKGILSATPVTDRIMSR